MGLKSFFIKQALKRKGLSSDEAEKMAKEISDNPEMVASLKKLEENKEVKVLLDKIQKEIEEKKKSGMPEAYAMMNVMSKYKMEIAKYKDELAPLMQLMMHR